MRSNSSRENKASPVQPYWSMIEPLKPLDHAFTIRGKRFSDLGDAINLMIELRRFVSSIPGKISRAEFLEESFIDGYKKDSSLDTSRFTIKRNGWWSCDIWRDTFYGFSLCSPEDKPLAMIGFEPVRNAILVSQLQGVKGADYLSDLKWPNALLNTAFRWAHVNMIPEVLVLPHTRNRYESVRINKTGAKMIYDVTAKREGFRFDPERQVYCRSTSDLNGPEGI